MSEEHNTDETAENKSFIPVNRRRFVKGLGVAGGVSVFGSMTVSAEKPTPEIREVSQRDIEAVIESHAKGVLNTLTTEGLLPEASINELLTNRTTTDPQEEGAMREIGGEHEHYAVRQRTDHGLLTVLVRPATNDAIGVLMTDQDYEVYDSSGRTSADAICGGCQRTNACPSLLGNPTPGLFCFGGLISCC